MPPESLPGAPARAWREVLLLWAGGLIVLAASDALGGLGGVIGRNQGALTAAYFLLAPVILLRRRGVDPADFGIAADRPLRALLAALAVGAAVFPPYVAAYEVYARVTRDASLRIPEHPLSNFPVDLRDRPRLPGVPGVRAWLEAERLWVLNASGDPATVRVDGCGCPARGLEFARGGLYHVSRVVACGGGGAGPARLDPGRGFSCPAGESEHLTIGVEPAVRVLAGAGSVETGPGGGTFGRTTWWIPELLLVQLVVIALPEEVFYRGYVQTRLRPLFRRRLRLLGAEVGLDVPLASVLFAVSHLVTVPAPFRLAVFFPGLLFGWLRERTGSVLAPAILHALCNVLLEVLQRYHG